MKLKLKLCSLAIALVSALALTSCCWDCIQSDETIFNVSPPQLIFTPSVLSHTFTVQSTMLWKLVDMPGNFEFTPIAGKFGLTSVTVKLLDPSDPVFVYAQASNGDIKKVELIYYPDDDPPIPPPPPRSFGKYAYVGAFWRADQVGERIIRIGLEDPDNPDPANFGPWSAQVVALDARWAYKYVSPVVLSTDTRNLHPNLWTTGDPGDAEDYKVTGDAILVSGVADAENPVLFRIGLKNKFTKVDGKGFEPDTPDYNNTFPARYGLIQITYGTPVKSFYIYLRQGEGADYVMRPTDAINSGGMSASTRPAAMRFSPYNLTATVLNADPGYRGGKFTQYPTQAGAFFQWANNTNVRYAYDPITTNLAMPATGAPTAANDYWFGGTSSNLANIHETCPVGYRRPNDGRTDAAVTVAAASAVNSEIRQSLWVTPVTGAVPADLTSSQANSTWGFYADGFFDRRAIETPPATPTWGRSEKTAVSVNHNNIAYAGNLFFNPTTMASLFFPAIGFRHPDYGGVLGSTGWGGVYWTSTSSEPSKSWCLNVNGNDLIGSFEIVLYPNGRIYGKGIRCVKENVVD